MTTSLNLDDLPILEGSTTEIQRIYLIRHGQSVLNLPDADGVQRVQGTSLQVELTPLGAAQAQRLHEKLIPRIRHLDLKLISSNATRAQQTMQIFSEYFGQEVDICPGLRELGSADWEGQRKEAAYHTAYKVWHSLSPKDKFTAPKMPGGESPIEVVQRAINDLDKVIQSAAGKTILGVCHDMTSNVLSIYLNHRIENLSIEPGKELPYIDIANCDIILLEVPTGESVEKGKVTALIKTGA
ncbi:MAG: histidine phosphatase family protein [Rhabdochlamydiaceae bacterium]|nr:histidine phosphatase family protein [Rhabdochlamydiaceae bacterium]